MEAAPALKVVDKPHKVKGVVIGDAVFVKGIYGRDFSVTERQAILYVEDSYVARVFVATARGTKKRSSVH